MGVKNVKQSCVIDSGNTGVGNCWNDIGIPRGLLFVDPKQVFTTASIAALKTQLEAALLADLPGNRLYPVQNIVEPTDNTTDPNTQQFAGDGSIIIAGENNYNLTFRWVDGGFCLLHSLRKSKGQTKAFFIIDSFGQLIGTDAGTTQNPEQIRGIVGYNYTKPFKFAISTSAVAVYDTMLSFTPDQVNENIAIVDFSNDGGLGYLSRLNGLFNVDITQAASPTSTTVTVKAKVSGCTNEDLYDAYADALAVPAAWQVNRADTGGTIVVSAVAKSAGTHGWVLTLAAATGLTVNVGLAGPTFLDSIDVSGYASNKLVQVIT